MTQEHPSSDCPSRLHCPSYESLSLAWVQPKASGLNSSQAPAPHLVLSPTWLQIGFESSTLKFGETLLSLLAEGLTCAGDACCRPRS